MIHDIGSTSSQSPSPFKQGNLLHLQTYCILELHSYTCQMLWLYVWLGFQIIHNVWFISSQLHYQWW